MKSRGHGIVLLGLVQHLTALTLISSFSCDGMIKQVCFDVARENASGKQYSAPNPLLLRLKVCFHIILVSVGDPFPAASSEIFLTMKIQCCSIAKPQKSKTLLLHIS